MQELLLRLLSEVLYDGVLADANLYVVVNLHQNVAILDLYDSSENSAYGNDFITLLEGTAELLKFLLLLSLRANHKEPHNDKNEGEHHPHHPTSALLSWSSL